MPDARQPTILYIEDDALNRRLVKRVLEPHGYRVVLAEDGLSGIESAERERPDLILMDINLPDIDGLAATVKLRSRPELATVPIVALTAGGFDRARDRSLTLGCSGFLTKPIDLATFPERIRQFLSGYRETTSRPVGKDTAQLFIRDESLALVTRLEEKIRELTVAKRELESTNEALQLAFDELQKSHEAEQRLHRARTDFIAVSSHELRTPLAVVLGYLDLLLSGHLGAVAPDVDRVLKVAQRNAVRLSSVVSQLADVARLEAGEGLRLEDVQVEDVVEILVSDLEPALHARGLSVDLELQSPRPVVKGDRERLAVLLQSLLMNAIRFTPDGGRLGVRTTSSDRDVRVEVRDDGVGLAPESLERIFEPFTRVQDSLHHSSGTFEFQSGGIGLGLTLARGIATAHGGTLRAESAGLGKGSTFVLTLPRERR